MHVLEMVLSFRFPLQRENVFVKKTLFHYENMTMLYAAFFPSCKKDNFPMKKYNIFLFLPKTMIVGTHLNHLIEAV